MCFAHFDWLLKLGDTSEQRQPRVTYEQNGFSVCCHQKQRKLKNNRRSCFQRHEEGDERLKYTLKLNSYRIALKCYETLKPIFSDFEMV